MAAELPKFNAEATFENDGTVRVLLTERETLREYIATLSAADLLENHPLFGDTLALCAALENTDGITAKFSRMPTGWKIHMVRTAMAGQFAMRDELVIECLGPVVRSDVERLTKQVANLRNEMRRMAEQMEKMKDNYAADRAAILADITRIRKNACHSRRDCYCLVFADDGWLLK